MSYMNMLCRAALILCLMALWWKYPNWLASTGTQAGLYRFGLLAITAWGLFTLLRRRRKAQPKPPPSESRRSKPLN